MHGHKLRWQHTTACLQESKDTYSQGFQRLFVDGIQLITKLKSNMKGALMSVSDRLLLRKRAIVETVNDKLKNIAQVEHSGHRCLDNFIVNLLGAIATYCLFPKKPRINIQRNFDTQLALFWIRRTHVFLNIFCTFMVWKKYNWREVLSSYTTKALLLVGNNIAFRVQSRYFWQVIALSLQSNKNKGAKHWRCNNVWSALKWEKKSDEMVVFLLILYYTSTRYVFSNRALFQIENDRLLLALNAFLAR